MSLKEKMKQNYMATSGAGDAQAVTVAAIPTPSPIGQDDLVIIEELQYLLPPLSDEEVQNLEASILEYGVKKPLDVWRRPEDNRLVLIDGHNRYFITKKNNLPRPKLNVMTSFKSLDDVKDWMVLNQNSQRNLTDFQKAYYVGLTYERMKGKRGVKTGVKVKDEVSKAMNVSESTAFRNHQLYLTLQQFSDKLRRDVLLEKTALNLKSLGELGKLKAERKFEEEKEVLTFLDKSKKKSPKKKSNQPHAFIKTVNNLGKTDISIEDFIEQAELYYVAIKNK